MKTEKEIYDYLRRELGRFEPVDPEGQTEFDWCLTKISREVGKNLLDLIKSSE